MGENAGYLSGGRKEGRDSVDKCEQFPIYSHSINCPCFQPQFSLLLISVPESSLDKCRADAAPGSVCSGLRLPGLLLPSTPFCLSSNFEKGVYWWPNHLLLSAVFIWMNSQEKWVKCWYIVRNCELCTYKERGICDVLQKLAEINRKSQFDFLSPFHSACCLWKNEVTI